MLQVAKLGQAAVSQFICIVLSYFYSAESLYCKQTTFSRRKTEVVVGTATPGGSSTLQDYESSGQFLDPYDEVSESTVHPSYGQQVKKSSFYIVQK